MAKFVLNTIVSRATPLTMYPLMESLPGYPSPRLVRLCVHFSSALVQGSSKGNLHLSRPDLPSGRDMDTGMDWFTFILGLWECLLFSGLPFPK